MIFLVLIGALLAAGLWGYISFKIADWVDKQYEGWGIAAFLFLSTFLPVAAGLQIAYWFTIHLNT